MQILLLILVFSSLAYGFQLQSRNSNVNTGSNNQYLTVNEFLDTKAQLQSGIDALNHEMEQLRHDTRKMLNMLAGQGEEKRKTFVKGTEQTLIGSQMHVCEQNYKELLNNYTKIHQKLETATMKISILEKEFIGQTNKTNGLSKELKDLKGLKKFHALQDISNLQQKVEAINSQTNEAEKTINTKLEKLDSQISIAKNAERVSLTACLQGDEYNSTRQAGYIIKFSDIRNQVGINDLTSFKSTGKFTCEKDGLYLITVTFLTRTTYGEVGIYKNDSLFTSTFSSSDKSGYAYSSTAVTSIELVQGDTISIRVVQFTAYIYAFNYKESCITIIKVM